jgi:hypothetical protein
MPDRCRLCTTNDRAALIEELAVEMWNRSRDHSIDFAWAECGLYWQSAFRQFASATLSLLERDHRA